MFTARFNKQFSIEQILISIHFTQLEFYFNFIVCEDIKVSQSAIGDTAALTDRQAVSCKQGD